MSFRRRRRFVEEQKVVEKQPRPEEQLEPSPAEQLPMSSALLRHPRLELPANVAPRAALLRAQQRAVGNAMLQRMLGGPVPVRGFLQSCPLRLQSKVLCPFGGACHACPARGGLAISPEGERLEPLPGTVSTRVEAPPGEEIEDEFGVPAAGHVLGRPVPFGPGPRSWDLLARQGLGPLISEALGFLQDARGSTGRRVKYGETLWAASKSTFPKIEYEWTPAEGNQFTGKVKQTTSKMGPISKWSLPAGEYVVPRSSVTANFPQCGSKGKKVPFATMISPEMASLAAQAEQEHENDYTRTYNLTLVKWAGIINSVAAQTFGPGPKDKVKREIDAALTAAGSKTRDRWVAEINRLNALSLQRDMPPGAAAHTLKSDGQPITCPDDCSKVVGTTVRVPSTNVPGVPSESLIN